MDGFDRTGKPGGCLRPEFFQPPPVGAGQFPTRGSHTRLAIHEVFSSGGSGEQEAQRDATGGEGRSGVSDIAFPPFEDLKTATDDMYTLRISELSNQISSIRNSTGGTPPRYLPRSA